ncbi:MAG: SDR family oxidoreductase [Clostridia bacterium]|nr:SDR family oxidoreductase [Clostridia bacterium]
MKPEKSRKVIITGGSRGIGAACVSEFAALGDDVVFIYEKDSEAASEIGRRTGARSLKYDLADYGNTVKAVSEAAELLGGCDVLVLCAGIARTGLFTEMSENDYSRLMGINLTSVFAASQTAAKMMIRQKKGSIVALGSVWGARGASCEAAYSASKAALRGLVSSLAKELGPSGIRVNLVEPGVIDTDMNAPLGPETLADLAASTSLCRLGGPEEVADAVIFLASEKASYVTGAVLAVDGGFVG